MDPHGPVRRPLSPVGEEEFRGGITNSKNIRKTEQIHFTYDLLLGKEMALRKGNASWGNEMYLIQPPNHCK